MSKSRRAQAVSRWAALARLLAAGCAALALVVGGFVQNATVRAQEASPTATVCVAPELPPGTPTPQMEGSPEAMGGMEMGTPPAVAEPPGAEASPEPGTPADEATAAAIEATIANYVACFNSGDPANYIALETENYWVNNYGSANPYDAIASESEGPPFTAEIVSISNPQTYADGRVSADVEVILGGHWFQDLTMFFVQDGEYWKLDEEIQNAPEPEGDTAVVGVALGTPDNEYTIVPNATSVVQPEVLIFHATNGGQEAHELLVIQLPEGADPMGLLDGSVSFDQVTFIGGVFDVAPGASQDLALIDLEPGTYTLICFFPSPDGTPHAALGMVTTFEVTAPAA
jgi:uncharacterized cupredoxin-like copper-binding protein